MSFRFPYDIASVLDPWREQLGDSFDEVVARLSDRDRALEDAFVDGHVHDGAGVNSIVVSGDTQTTPAVAAGEEATAIGEAASAAGYFSTALGAYANASGEASLTVGGTASGPYSAAFGMGAVASGASDYSTAVGRSAQATHARSCALGNGVQTTNTDQVTLGQWRAFIGAPNTAAADADLQQAQMTFYLDETGHNLVFKVKYAAGTVKTGSVALA